MSFCFCLKSKRLQLTVAMTRVKQIILGEKSADIIKRFATSTSYHLTPHLPGALTLNARFLPSNYALSRSPRRFPAERFAPGHVVSGKYDCAGKQFSICSAAIGPICIAFAIRYADKRRIIIGRRHLGLATMCVSGALSVTDVDPFIPRGSPIGDSKKTTGNCEGCEKTSGSPSTASVDKIFRSTSWTLRVRGNHPLSHDQS